MLDVEVVRTVTHGVGQCVDFTRAITSSTTTTTITTDNTAASRGVSTERRLQGEHPCASRAEDAPPTPCREARQRKRRWLDEGRPQCQPQRGLVDRGLVRPHTQYRNLAARIATWIATRIAAGYAARIAAALAAALEAGHGLGTFEPADNDRVCRRVEGECSTGVRVRIEGRRGVPRHRCMYRYCKAYEAAAVAAGEGRAHTGGGVGSS